MTKVCSKCKVEQPVGNFSKNCGAPNGVRSSCRDCNNAHSKAYKAEHAVETRAYSTAYYAAHQEECRARYAAYISTHREEHRAWDIANYAVNKDKLLARTKAFREAHPELMRIRRKVWRDNNEDVQKKATATWRKNNPDAHRVHVQTRAARKASLPATLTTSQWKHILKEFNNTCAYCGAGDKGLHQEHFIALYKGGAYTHENIIPACGSCNSSKSTKSFGDWYPTFKHYSKEREKRILRFIRGRAHNELALGEQVEMAEQASVEESK